MRRAAPAAACARTFAAATRGAFDRALHVDELLRPALTATLDEHAAPFGLRGGSRFELFCASPATGWGASSDGVRTPLLVVEATTAGPASRASCSTACPGRSGWSRARETHVFDWLDAHLA